MSIIFKCDRCGETYTDYSPRIVVETTLYRANIVSEKLNCDICPECYKKLLAWIKEVKNA